MTESSPAQLLRALPVHLVETRAGVLVKRGRAEIQATGDTAKELVLLVLHAGAGAGFAVEELLASLPVQARPAVADLIRQLALRRMLVPSGPGSFEPAIDGETPLDVFYWSFEADAATVTARINSAPIAILGVNSISRQLASSLARAGTTSVEVVDYAPLRNLAAFGAQDEPSLDDWGAGSPRPVPYASWMREAGQSDSLGCLVATSDFGGLALMRQWNQHCVSEGIPFLPVVLQDLTGYVGPLVIPGETACFECLRARQNSHLNDPETERAAEPHAFRAQHVAAFHPAMASILGDIAAIELTKFRGGFVRRYSTGSLIEVDLIAPKIRSRTVLRVPRCTACGALRRTPSTSVQQRPFIPVD